MDRPVTSFWLARWRARWSDSLQLRLTTLGLAPLLLAFPLVLGVLIVLGGQIFDRLLAANALSKVNGVQVYLDDVRTQAEEHVRRMATIGGSIGSALDRLGTNPPREADATVLREFEEVLQIRARAAQFDYLIVADDEGRVIASSVGMTPGTRIPDTFVTRQARTGVAASAFERLEAVDLQRLSAELARRATVDLVPPSRNEQAVFDQGLAIDAAVHFPLSARHQNAILLGGILINRNAALVDRVREVVFPVADEVEHAGGTTTIYLGDVAVATNAVRRDGERALGTRPPADVTGDVLHGSGGPVRPAWRVSGWQVAGYQAITNGEGQRIGIVQAGFPEARFAREKWLLLGSVAGILALAMLGLTGVNVGMAGHLARRLARIAHAMTRLREGNLAARVGGNGLADEIGQLARHFDAMAEALATHEEAQRRARAEVEAEASLRRMLFEHSRDGIVVLNPDGSVYEANHRFAEMLGYTEDDVRGLVLRDFDAGSGQLELSIALQGIDAGGSRFETVERRKDGSLLDVEVSASRIDWGGHTFVLCLQRDVTARKRAEAELVAAKEAAASGNLAKTQFLAHMSHEIRTPLNVVVGLAQVLAHEPLTPEQKAMIRTMDGAGRSLQRIINDILDFSKIEAGQLRIEEQVFDLASLLERIDGLLRGSAEAKGLGLVVTGPRESVGPMVGDALRVEQVLVNLVGNAIKFTERGKVDVRALAVAAPEGMLRMRFEVADTGIGIDPESLATLFAPFTQADPGITRRFGGTGLGLAISKRLVQQMGGTIGAESRIGEGSTFWFEVPFRPADPQAEAAADPEASAARKVDLTGLRVLAVDDNRLNLFVLQRGLERSGVEVTLAADGQQALQMLRARPEAFDVVLMDVQMPVMDGLTATREIRTDSTLAGMPVVALTAGALAEERQAALAAGMNAFIAKPVDFRVLGETLATFLRTPGDLPAQKSAESAISL